MWSRLVVGKLNRFIFDVRGVIAVQVVVFSVLLLSAAGFMIDFGRAYNAHSDMQSTVDKIALAAAQELDGTATALTRAAAAANAIASADDNIAVSEIIYLSGEPSDTLGNFDASKLTDLTYVTTNPLAATHVYVRSVSKQVRFSLMRLNISAVTGDLNAADVQNIAFSAQAVATRNESFCGPISTMVMCNPFEDTGMTFADAMTGQAGAQMLLTADTDVNAEPRLLADDNRIRVGLLKNPITEIGADPLAVCSGAGLQLFQSAGYAPDPIPPRDIDALRGVSSEEETADSGSSSSSASGGDDDDDNDDDNDDDDDSADASQFIKVLKDETIAYASSDDDDDDQNDDDDDSEPSDALQLKNGAVLDGQGVRFDGQNDYAFIEDTGVNQIDNGTVSITFSMDRTDGPQTLVSKDANNFSNGGHVTMRVDNGMIVVRLQTTQQNHEVRTSRVIEAGQVHTVDFDFGESGMAVYVDGELHGNQATKDFTGGIAGNTESWVFGANQWNSSANNVNNLQQYFDGVIYDFSVTNNDTGSSDTGVAFNFGYQVPGQEPAPAEPPAEPEVEYVASDWTFPTTDEGLERLQDACMLAMVDSGLQCLGSQVLIKAAHPGDVVTGLNTIFDIWDAPLDRVLTEDTHSVHFQPDYVATHGMINRWEFNEYLSILKAESEDAADEAWSSAAYYQDLADDAWFFISKALFQANADEETSAAELADAQAAYYQTLLDAYPDNIANTASRANHMMIGNTLGWGPMPRQGCLADDPASCETAYIAPPGTVTLEASNESLVLYSSPQWALLGSGVSLTSLGESITGQSSAWRLRNLTWEDETISVSFVGQDHSWDFDVPARSKVAIRLPGTGTLQASYDGGSDSQSSDEQTEIFDFFTNILMAAGVTNKEACSYAHCAFETLPGEFVYVWNDLPAEMPMFLSYFQSYYEPFATANGLKLGTGDTDIEVNVSTATSLYEGYSTVERVVSELLDEGSSSGIGEDNRFIQTAPSNYVFGGDPTELQSKERRRQRVAIVNCGAATAHATFAGAAIPGYEDTYVGNVVDVADVFLTEAPHVTGCAPGSTGDDPAGFNTCWNDDVTSAEIFVEFISSAAQDNPTFGARAFATLVY